MRSPTTTPIIVSVEVYRDGWQPCPVDDATVFFEGFCPVHLCALGRDGCQMIPQGFDGKVAPYCPACDMHWRGKASS